MISHISFLKPSYYIFLFLLSLAFNFSCNVGNNTIDKGYYFQDFDNLYYWNKSTRVTDEKAFSGKYSAFVDSLNEFSQTFEMDLSYARFKGYKKLKVKAWCFKESDDAKAGLVASVVSGDQTLNINSSDLAESLKKSGAWGACTFSIDLPQVFPDNTKIRVYLWSSAGDKVYVDDIELIFKK